MRTLIVSAVLLLVSVAALPVFAQPPAGQDWVVTQDTFVSNETINMDLSSITVMPGATLELADVVLRFNQTYYESGGMLVKAGATLRMERCVVNDLPRNVYPHFVVQGTAELSGCALNRLGYNNISGGIEVEGGRAELTGCSFCNMSYSGLSCDGSSVTLDDCSFATSNNQGIDASGSILDIRNCTFHGYSEGINAYHCDVNLSRSAFSNFYYCTDLRYCTVSVTGCSFNGEGGSLSELPTVGPGTFGPSSAQLSITGCDFSDMSVGCQFIATNYGGNYAALILESCQQAVVQNCTVSGFSNCGVQANGMPAVYVGNCSFSNNREGVNCEDYDKDNCVISGCDFSGSSTDFRAIYTYDGGASFLNNTVHVPANTYYQALYFDAASDVIGNRLFSASRNYQAGVYIDSIGTGKVAEVSQNSFDGMLDAIYSQANTGILLVANNTMTNCTNGINFTYDAELRGNTMNVSQSGIRVLYPEGYSWPASLVVADNDITSAGTGVVARADRVLEITGNRIRSGSDGIDVGPMRQRLDRVLISRNEITAVRDGMAIDSVDRSGGGSVDNNTVAGAETGITVERSNLDLSDNSMSGIGRWGISALDSLGDYNRSLDVFSGADNSSREVRRWSVGLTVRYNANPPGDPVDPRKVDQYDVLVKDANGPVDARFDPFNQSMVLSQYQVLGNGSRHEYNPYCITASSPGKGAVRTSFTVTGLTQLSLVLQKGPDLVATYLNLSDRLPVEGELMIFCATAQNDGTFNPDGIPALYPRLQIVLDDVVLSSLEPPDIPNETAQPLSAAWVAIPGWHNVTFAVDVYDLVKEVFEDNNAITVPFYVMPLPAGELGVNETEPVVGLPVEFSICATGEATGYRFDFGDGALSDWLSEPHANHTYLLPGDYVVRGYLVTGMGNLRECRMPLLVAVSNYPSWAALKAYPDPALSGQSVLFTVSFTGWGVNLTHQIWYFGDGGYSYSANVSQAEHTYQRPGNYTVECALSFEDGSSRTYRLDISVGSALPVAAGKVSPGNGTVATLFTFSSESVDTNGNMLGCVWDFGDGESSHAPFTTHAYSNHGLFTVNLTVEDGLGQWSAPRSFPVVVGNTPPSAHIGPVKQGAAPGSKLLFDGTGTADPDDALGSLAFSWDFGDGSSATGVQATHAYERAGRYIVRLTVSDGAGGVTSATVSVEVRQAVTAEIGWQFPAAFGLVIAVLVVAVVLILRFRKKGGERMANGARRKAQGARDEGAGRKGQGTRNGRTGEPVNR